MPPNRDNGNGHRNGDSTFQKYLQTGFQVIMVAVVMWVGSSVISMRDSIIRQEEYNKRTEGAILDIKSDILTLRTATALNSEKFITTAQTLRDIESKILNLERDRSRRGRGSEGL